MVTTLLPLLTTTYCLERGLLGSHFFWVVPRSSARYVFLCSRTILIVKSSELGVTLNLGLNRRLLGGRGMSVLFFRKDFVNQFLKKKEDFHLSMTLVQTSRFVDSGYKVSRPLIIQGLQTLTPAGLVVATQVTVGTVRVCSGCGCLSPGVTSSVFRSLLYW